MIIDCIADLHGYYPKLEGGDLLIVAGDLTARDTRDEYDVFNDWLMKQNYPKKVIVAGNHDGFLEKQRPGRRYFSVGCYLQDSIEEYEGLKIWGTPWTKTFEEMNPHCKAFTCDTEEELAEKWAKIPDDIDILITHGPPHGILDWNANGMLCGSKSLFEKSRKLKNLKLFIFGHIHEAYSMIDCQKMSDSLLMLLSNDKPNCLPIIVNCSHVNEYYEPVNKPVRIIL